MSNDANDATQNDRIAHAAHGDVLLRQCRAMLARSPTLDLIAVACRLLAADANQAIVASDQMVEPRIAGLNAEYLSPPPSQPQKKAGPKRKRVLIPPALRPPRLSGGKPGAPFGNSNRLKHGNRTRARAAFAAAVRAHISVGRMLASSADAPATSR